MNHLTPFSYTLTPLHPDPVFAVGVGEGGALRWWAMGGAASFAKRWSWFP